MIKKYKNFMESFLDELKRVMKDITELLTEKGIRFCFIGGAAKNIYGSKRTTEDIDILINKEDKEKMLNLPIGFIREISNKRGKVFWWHNPKTKLEVIYDGEYSGSNIKGIRYKKPEDMTLYIDDLPLIDLYNFIEYKLCAGTYGALYRKEKDYADVKSLIKDKDLDIHFGDDFREDLKNIYIRLWTETQDRDEFDN